MKSAWRIGLLVAGPMLGFVNAISRWWLPRLGQAALVMILLYLEWLIVVN